MPDRTDDDNKRLSFDRFCDRYLAYWMLSCVAASVFVGWGALVAWFGLVVAMNAFRRAVLSTRKRDDRLPYRPRNGKRH